MRIANTITATLLMTFSVLAWAAEFGDHCTTGMAHGQMMKTDCSIKSMFEGKTYCFSTPEAKNEFMMHPAETIAKAKEFQAKNAETVRTKITQEDAMQAIKSSHCDLSDKDAGYLDFKGMDLHHCRLVNTSFFGSDLRGANLSGADMQRAYLNLARLENTNLSGADLTDATIFAAIFNNTNFTGANLTHARIMGNLGNVNMSGANLKNGRLGMDFGNQTMGQVKFDSVGGKYANADFSGANLQVASFRFGDLRGANLSNTNLYRADLIQADLTGADLTGADLTDADVDGAIFKEAKGLQTVKGMKSAKGKCKDCGR